MKHWIWMILLCLILSGCQAQTVQRVESPKVQEVPSGAAITYAVCEDPVYKVVVWEAPEEYEMAPLYVATLEPPQDLREKRETLPSKTEVPIAKFSTIGDSDGNQGQVGRSFFLPVAAGGKLRQIYYLTSPVGSGFSFSANDVDDFMSLASLTSEETPMYLVLSGDFLYAVIGETAYYISDWNQDNAPEYLPELYLGEGEVFVERIDLY